MLSFTVIGVIHCPAQIGATPFSMGVDKNAVAWVLYSSGEVFHVDTQTAQCSKTNFAANQNGFSTFGMGFVADAKGAHAEHLYVADTGLSQLGVMDPAKLVLQAVGGLNGTPELTGTGDATLWGFFPDVTLPHVAQLDKLTAKEGTTFQLNSLAGTPTAWAFAFWGGDFWIFLKRDLDTSTHVYHLTPANGMVVDAVPNTGFSIVGAGVSICAPTGPTNH
jgi:hypothetical protein